MVTAETAVMVTAAIAVSELDAAMGLAATVVVVGMVRVDLVIVDITAAIGGIERSVALHVSVTAAGSAVTKNLTPCLAKA
jgi:hypothetical protein